MSRANFWASFGQKISANQVALSASVPTDLSELTDSTNLLGSGAGVQEYATVDDMISSQVGLSTGSLGFVLETNRLYLYNGTGWYNIALGDVLE